MNVSKIANKLTVVSILAAFAAFAAPLAIGCAAPSGESTEGEDAPLGAAPNAAAPGLNPVDIIEDMAKQLAAIAAGRAAHALFPEPGIDLEKLMSDIDANTRRAIMDEAMRQDKGAIDAALGELKDIELQKADIGKPGHKSAADLYAETDRMPTLANIDMVRAKLGPDAATLYKREGIKLYATAVQIDASRLMLLAQLDPTRAESQRTVLVNHLRAAVAHVRVTTKEARQAELDSRLAMISACHQYHEMSQGGRVNHYVRYEDNASGAQWGQSDSFDYATAIGRCDADRDGHYGRVEAAIASNMDAKFGLAMTMAAQWSLAADAIEAKPASASDTIVGLDFGGMYGWSFISGQPNAQLNVNPFTGGASCPGGYDAVKIVGKANVDYDAFQCVRKTNGTTEPVADFGGMWGERDYREQVQTAANPVTGSASCAAGFVQYRLLGGDSTDRNLFYCARRHVAGTPNQASKFGGVFSRAAGNANPLSEGTSCANGFTPSQVWGSNGQYGWRVDQAMVVCTKQ